MKIRRKKTAPKAAGSSAGRGVFLDRPGEFLALFSMTLENDGAHGGGNHVSRAGGNRSVTYRKTARMAFCVLLILSLASMKVHGWGWAEEAFDFWKPRLQTEASPASAMSEDALLDAAVSLGWAERLAEDRREEAAILLESWAGEEVLSDPAQQTLSILKWLTSLKADDPGGGEESVVSILEDDSRLPRRLDFWERNRPEIRAVVAKLIGRNGPESLGKRIYHRIDALQTQAYLYLGDIRELKRKILDAVEADRTHALYPVLEEFRKRHPDVGGIQELRADLEILEAVRNTAREGRMDRARRIRDGHAFVSEVLARHAARISTQKEIPVPFLGDAPAPPGSPEEARLLSSPAFRPERFPALPPGSVRLSELEIRKPVEEMPSFRLLSEREGGAP